MSDNDKTKEPPIVADEKPKKPKRKGGVLLYFDEPTKARLNDFQRDVEAANPGLKIDRKSLVKMAVIEGLKAVEFRRKAHLPEKPADGGDA